MREVNDFPEDQYPGEEPIPVDPETIEEARRKVRVPAIAMIVSAGVQILLSLWQLISILTGGLAAQFEEQRQQVDRDPKMNQVDKDMMKDFLASYEKAMNVMLPIDLAVMLLSTLVILYGSWKMLKLQSRGWAKAASVMTMIPCFICCAWGIPIGIWSLMVLLKPDVKLAFSVRGIAETPPEEA